MKSILLFIFILLFSVLSIAQGDSCSDAEPFCTGSTYNFPAGVNNGSAEVGNNYDCLFTQPNPAWYYMEIDQPGNMTIQISNSGNQDIDFILYGPYTSYANAMANCGGMGFGITTNTVIDCSYSTAATEYADITNAQTGEVYVLLITNYSNQNTNISFTNTAGTATTDCSIVEPCAITSLNVTIGACTPATGLFNVTGTVGIVDPPTTGSLIAVDCNGNQTTVANAPFGSTSYNFAINNITADGAACGVNVYFTADPACAASVVYNNPPPCDPDCFITYLETNISACDPSNNTFSITGVVEFQDAPASGTMTVTDCNGNSQVFNAPFTSPTNYALTGITPNGTTNCTVTVTFSADPACTMSSGTFNYPPACDCPVDAGTYTNTLIGDANSSNPYLLCFGDQLNIVGNGDFIPPNDVNSGVTYDPGVWLLVYDCPPTVGSPDDINGDPCLLGVASTADQAWAIANTTGNGTTLYFVPLTMYSMVDGYYSSTNSLVNCYDMGPVTQITYLPQITATPVENCQAGTLATTVSGGLPAQNGSNFTASNLSPASASFDNTTAANGGTINVSGLVDGDNYSFDITDANGCPITISGTFTGTQDASFTYPSNQYCQNQPNPSPTVTGVTGGTFSSTAGLSINASTGVINLAASTPGTYTVSYQSPHAVCFSIETFIITIDPQPVITVNDPSICAGQTVTLTANGANTYTWSPGTYLTGTTGTSVDATPPSTISYTVTGTNTVTGCQNTDIATVTVNPLPIVNAGADDDICINESIALTGSGNAASYTWDNGVTNGVGFSPVSTNTYTVTGISAAGCENTDQVTITVNPLPNVFAGDDFSVCTGSTVTLSGSGAISYTWTNGVTNGVGFVPAGTATYTVTGTDANGCVNTDAITVTVLNSAPINAGPDQTICEGENATITATGGVTYTWDNGLGAGASHVVSPSVTTTYTVDGEDANGCTGTDQVTITVNPLPTATITGTTAVCQNDASPVITFTGANGTSPYTFTYNINGGVNQTIVSTGNIATINAPTGTVGTFDYNLISVQDDSGTTCSQAQTGIATVVVNPLPTATISGTAEVCQNDATPIITFTGASGTSPYTFTYNINGGANQTIVSTGDITTINAPTGIVGTFDYNLVSVEDASGTACSQAQTGTATVVVNPLPTAMVSGTIAVCQNDASPVITFTGANGTSPYTFTYNINGGASQTIVSTGNIATINVPTTTVGIFDYNLVSVEDASGTTCSQAQTGTATIVVNPLPTATISGTTEVCQNDASPVITFTGANGTSPYTFTYNINGGANQTVTTASGNNSVTINAPTGTSGTFDYNLVSVQDASTTTCSQPQPQTVTVLVNPLPTATVASNASVCVGDADPIITFTGSNGTSPYIFSYNINGGTAQTIVSTGDLAAITISASAAGTFNVNLTAVEDASSTTCSQVLNQIVTVVVNPNPVVSISGASEYCTGSSADLDAGAGFATYSWSNGATTQTTNVTEADNDITVTVSNAAGCTTISAPFTVTENSVITANYSFEICQGESMVIHGVTQNTSGLYSQTFVSATGCDSTSNVTLTVHPLPVVFAGNDFAVCNGEPVTLSGSGAVDYVWDNAIINGVPFTPVATQTYEVTGTDANGCVNVDQIVVAVNPLPTATVSGTTAVCQNSAQPVITFTGANGTSPYTFTYNINGGANQTVVSTGNAATVSVPTGTVGTFTYNLVSVQDGSTTACSQTQSGSATVTVNPLPTATVSGTTAVCQNSAQPVITFTGTNGTSPYTFTYNINGGANQTVVSTGNTATVSAPTGTVGTFTYNLISVQDASTTACSQTQSGSVTVTVNPLPTATVSGTTAVCQNSAQPVVTFTGANGTSPYTFTYNINGGANQTLVSMGNTATVSTPTESMGTFTYNLVSVQDASTTACSQTQSGSATVTVNPLPTATVSGTTVVCQNSAQPVITFTGANGTSPYTFTYNINGGANQTVVSTGNTATVSAPTGTVGTFTYNLVSVQDGSTTACSQTQSGSATVTVNPLPTATVSGTTAVCQNDASPVITFTGANGTSPYTFTYNINGGANQTVVSTGNTATVSAPTGTVGTFTYNLVSVQDGSTTTCLQAQSGNATVTVNPLPTATISGTIEVCINAASPNITFTGANGTAPYTFTYNINGGANQTVVSSGNTATVSVPTGTAGTFTYNLVSVQDASSTTCSQAQSGSATVTVHALPNVFAGNDLTICEGQTALLTASGANSYVWNNGVSNGVPFVPTGTTTYTVTGTSVAGCSNTDDVIVNVVPTPAVSFTGVNLTGCSPVTPTFTNTSTGTLTNCVWSFSNGQTLAGCGNVSSTFTTPGCYDVTLTVTTPEGCSNSTTAVNYVCVEPDPVANFSANPNAMTTIDPSTHLINLSTGASSYNWSFGDGSGTSNETSPTHTYPDEAGTYVITLIAYSPAGCTDTMSQVVTVTEELIFYVPNAFTPDNDQYNEVFKPVFTSGFDPYNYNLLIFNRWGEVLFESNDTDYGWNGTYGGQIVQDGVYIWKITVKRSGVDDREQYIGHVTLIR